MSGILDIFIPKEKKFLNFLHEQVKILDDCVEKLNEFSFNHHFDKDQKEKTLQYIQKKNDIAINIAKEVTISLHQTFITPIDREEIQSLSLSINRTLDIVEKIAASILYFKLKKLDRSFLQQVVVLEKLTKALQEIFKEPLHTKRNIHYIESIKKLEEKADEVFGKARGQLFNNGHTPIEILKHKELYDLAEQAIDTVRATVDILDIVLINNS